MGFSIASMVLWIMSCECMVRNKSSTWSAVAGSVAEVCASPLALKTRHRAAIQNIFMIILPERQQPIPSRETRLLINRVVSCRPRDTLVERVCISPIRFRCLQSVRGDVVGHQRFSWRIRHAARQRLRLYLDREHGRLGAGRRAGDGQPDSPAFGARHTLGGGWGGLGGGFVGFFLFS